MVGRVAPSLSCPGGRRPDPGPRGGLRFEPDGRAVSEAGLRRLKETSVTGIVAKGRAGAHRVLDGVFLCGGEDSVGSHGDTKTASLWELAVGDRVGAMVRSQAMSVHPGDGRDLEGHTTNGSALDCARRTAVGLNEEGGYPGAWDGTGGSKQAA